MGSQITTVLTWSFVALTVAVIVANRMSVRFKNERWRARVRLTSRLFGLFWVLLLVFGTAYGVYEFSQLDS